jgi:hypothetical protein
VRSWWKEISGTRLNDQKRSAIAVEMQRLHSGDLSGVILDEVDEDWVHLMIPMEFDSARCSVTVVLPSSEDGEPWHDPRQYEGELMWKERFGEAEVERMKNRLGPYMASGRLQQMPVPKGGGIIHRAWWQPWDAVEAQSYGLEWSKEPKGLKEFPQMELVIGSMDTAFKEKEENDYTAMTVWGIWTDKNRNKRAMLMYAWNERKPLHGPDLAQEPNELPVLFRRRQHEAWGVAPIRAGGTKSSAC